MPPNNVNNNNPNNNNNNNNGGYQPPFYSKTIFVKEIRNRIEAYFKLIVRNLRDSIPKCIGNNLVKEIENNMQIELYNQLYKSNEVVSLLNEPEHIAIRRKELVELIKVMKNAQKIIRRDPDLMTVMKININDSDIAPPKEEKPQPQQQQNVLKQPIPENNNIKPNTSSSNLNKPNGDVKKKNYGNLFG
jgi:dynamin 1-like protein